VSYVVGNARGDQATFVHEEDALDFARRKSRADRGAFSWWVCWRETTGKHVASFVRGEGGQRGQHPLDLGGAK
jgi:hypothetical protein